MNELNAFLSLFASLTSINHWDLSSDTITSGKSFQIIQAVLCHQFYTLHNTMNLSLLLVPS